MAWEPAQTQGSLGRGDPDGRWRVFDYEELLKRDKVNLDIFWLRDKSLEESDDLPEPDVLAQEIADDMQTALKQFSAIAEKLKGSDHIGSGVANRSGCRFEKAELETAGGLNGNVVNRRSTSSSGREAAAGNAGAPAYPV